MNTPKFLVAAVGAATIIAVQFGSTAYAASGDPSQWGIRSAAASASHVNEYEGQHRAAVAAGGGKNGEVPVVTG